MTQKQTQGGLTLSDLTNAKKTITIDLADVGFDGVEPLEVTFRPNFWTPPARQKYLAEDTTVDQSNAELFTSAVISWNLTDDGEPIPVTMAALETISAGIIDAVVQAMLRAVRPNPKISQG